MLVRLRLDERVDDRPAQKTSERREHEADEYETCPGGAQQQPASPFREEDRKSVEGDDGDQKQRAQSLEDPHSRLGGLELARLHEHQLAGIRIAVRLELVLHP